MAELRGRFGKAVVFGTLQGANRARLRELGAPGLKSYGTLQALPRDTPFRAFGNGAGRMEGI